MLHLGCKCNLKVIFLHEASKSMKVPAEINNLASQGYWNHDSGGKKQQSSSQSHENQDNPNRSQQSSFAEPPASQQFQQISTILHLQRPRPRPSQLHIPLSKTMKPYRHPAQHTASRMQVQCESHSSSQSHKKHDSPSRDQQSSFARLLESRQSWQKATS